MQELKSQSVPTHSIDAASAEEDGNGNGGGGAVDDVLHLDDADGLMNGHSRAPTDPKDEDVNQANGEKEERGTKRRRREEESDGDGEGTGGRDGGRVLDDPSYRYLAALHIGLLKNIGGRSTGLLTYARKGKGMRISLLRLTTRGM